VDDSIEGIMLRGIAENAFLSKWAGGLGGSWTAVRGTGAYIGGTNGESQGVIPFLKLHNDQLVAVNQGGKRKGSGCAYLESGTTTSSSSSSSARTPATTAAAPTT
jgi:ribonucleoside-diphosphate reductase alpha chain